MWDRKPERVWRGDEHPFSGPEGSRPARRVGILDISYLLRLRLYRIHLGRNRVASTRGGCSATSLGLLIARSPRTDGAVFRTDSLVDVAFLFALIAVQHIAAQNINFASPGYLVPEVFQLNRRICLPLRPQRRCTFATGSNSGVLPRVLPLRRFGVGCDSDHCNR